MAVAEAGKDCPDAPPLTQPARASSHTSVPLSGVGPFCLFIEFDPDTFSLKSPAQTRSVGALRAPPLAPPGASCFRGVQEALPSPRQPRVSSA